MIIYNITYKVEWSVAKDWLNWMQETHIAEILDTNCFEKHQLVRLLQTDETEGQTYACQFYAPSLSKYDYYLQHYARSFKEQIQEKWGENYVDFHTLMEVIEKV